MTQNKEQRTHLGGLEIRKNEDGTESRTIEGYGVVFESKSHQLGWFVETVSRTAFDGVNLDDVVATFNHDFNMVMARTSSKTLTLSIDNVGVKYRFDAPNTTAGNDLLENVRNGNVVGSSFMFTIAEDRWTFKNGSDEVDEREILKVDRLYELGPVTMPAYPDTTAQAKRTYEEAKKEFTKEDVEAANNTKKRNIELKIKLIKTKS
jgi:uncharacterized protein